MKFNLRKFIQLFTYYLIPFYMLINVGYKILNEIDIYEEVVSYGNAAFILIVIIMMVKPLCVLFGNKVPHLRKAMSYRREFGVLSFWFAVFHSFSLIWYLGMYDLKGILQLLNPTEFFYFTGLLALLGMIILGLTSNQLSLLKFKGNWKKIQMLAYPTFLLVVLHKFTNHFDIGPFIIFSIYVILKFFEIRKFRLAKVEAKNKLAESKKKDELIEESS